MIEKIKKIGYSKITIIIIISILVWRTFNLGLYKNKDEIISWDVISYYSYVPAVIIHHDYTMSFILDNKKPYTGIYWPSMSPINKLVCKTSMGMAFLYTPFFCIAHIYCLYTSNVADGFSPPYKLAILLADIFYLFIGLIFLRKLLLKYFSEWVISLTFISIVLGTNLYNYSTHDGAMSHSFSLSIMCMFMYYSIQWYNKITLRNSIYIGLLGGLISLVRPTNIIIILFFLLYDITDFNSIKKRFQLFFSKFYYILLIIFFAFIVWLPQLLYWKSQTGQFLFYSYEGEQFFFNNPQILKVLFSYNNGWLVYSPIMLFSIIGIVLCYKKLKSYFYPILIFTVINLWIISSWWCWWYSGYGLRALIDSYCILSIPLAIAFQTIFSLKPYIKYFLIFLIFIFISYGTLNSYKYSKGIIHYEAMTKKAFWALFFRMSSPEGYYDMLECIDNEKAHKGIYVTGKCN